MSPFASSAPVFGCPSDIASINSHLSLDHGLVMMVEHLLREANDVLSLVVVYELEVLQCGDHILFPDARLLTYLTGAAQPITLTIGLCPTTVTYLMVVLGTEPSSWLFMASNNSTIVCDQ